MNETSYWWRLIKKHSKPNKRNSLNDRFEKSFYWNRILMGQKLYLIKFIVSYCCILALNFSSISSCIEIITMNSNIRKWIVNIATKMKPCDSISKQFQSCKWDLRNIYIFTIGDVNGSTCDLRKEIYLSSVNMYCLQRRN